MLRAARLALVGSAAASIGVIVLILSRAASFSPFLVLFALAAFDFVAAARTLEHDRRKGRLLAWAGALTLAGMGTLAGFGAGEVAFPAAALGLVAAVLASLIPPSRAVLAAVAAYLLVGLALFASRLPALAALPWLLPSVFVWPLTLTFTAGGLAIFAVIGAGVALAVAAMAPPIAWPRARLRWPVAVGAALVSGLASDLLEIVLALAQPNTSARAELGALPLAILFVAGALFGAGLVLSASRTAGGLVMTTLGGAVLIYALFARPTVVCAANGVATSSGPWWLPAFGPMSSRGSSGSSGDPGGASGVIERGDGVTIVYRCAAGELVEFEIRR